MSERREALARALGDALRLELLDHLAEGPAFVSALVEWTGSEQSQISHHLRTLRDAELVSTERKGRAVEYQLASLDVAELVNAARRLIGDGSPPQGDDAHGRICFDAIGGRLGAAILHALRDAGAIVTTDPDSRALGVAPGIGVDLFARLGVDVDDARGRRRYAFEETDAVVGGPYLAGSLGARLLEEFQVHGWVDLLPPRGLRLTAAGRTLLSRVLGPAPPWA